MRSPPRAHSTRKRTPWPPSVMPRFAMPRAGWKGRGGAFPANGPPGGAAGSRHETLAALESRLEGYGEGARALLAADATSLGILGALPQAVEPVESRFERPLDRYLESLGHALLARDRTAAVQGAERLVDHGSGRADFLIPEF